MHTGDHTGDDAEERELFARLEREFADVTVPRRLRRGAVAPPRAPRQGMPKTTRLVAWLVVLGLGAWSFSHTPAGRSLAAAAGWGRTAPSGDGYVFMSESPTGPVRWSSCHAIEIVVNEALRPAGTGGMVDDAVAEVADASGLELRVVGVTDEQPSDRRPAEQSRYGASWAPVLVAWTTPEQDPGLAGDTVGLGGGGSLTIDGMARYVTGQVTLDAPQMTEILTRPDGVDQARSVVVHELAHVLGLGHVDDVTSLMAESGGATELSDGDRAGLRAAGSGPCL